MITRGKRGRMGETGEAGKRYKLPVIIKISSGDVMHSMMTTRDLKSSHYKKKAFLFNYIKSN